MALKTLKCNHLMPLPFKGLIPFSALTTRVRLVSGSDQSLAADVRQLVGEVRPPSGTDDRQVNVESTTVASSAKGIRSAAR